MPPLLFDDRLATLDVFAWLNCKVEVPEVCELTKSIALPPINLTSSPFATSSILVVLLNSPHVGSDASYLVSKLPAVTPVTWPWSLVIIDLMYWPSCVPVIPYVPAIPKLSWSILIVSVPGTDVNVIASRPLKFNVSLLESATTSLVDVSLIVNVLKVMYLC